MERTLKDVLRDNGLLDKRVEITYRFFDKDGEDCLFGNCHWFNGKLTSDDGDIYGLEDIIIKEEVNEITSDYVELVVWMAVEFL